MPETMTQVAPYPQILVDLVAGLTYRPGWKISLADIIRDHVDPADDSSPALSAGLTLVITTLGYNSYHPELGQTYRVNHFFAVPPATYNEASWRHWLLERYFEVERHETCEFFTIAGEKPFAPNHSPGNDPYIVHEPSTELERRTSFQGVVNS